MLGDGINAIRLLAMVRLKAAARYLSDTDLQSPQVNGRGDLLVANSLPPGSEIVRMGKSYISRATTGTAPVTVLPTTAAHFSLWNGEALNGTIGYAIDAIGTYITTSAAAAITLGMGYCLNVGSVTNPAGSVAIKSLSGAVANTRGNTKEGVTITNDGWFQIGQTLNCNAPTANLTVGLEIPIDGKLIVPPQGLFSVASLCDAAGAAVCQPFIRWHEIDLASIN